MNLCIYSKQDDLTATFNSAEHIIPKCIGGIKCLPKGWVSDETNNIFSRYELDFARENPLIVLPRMLGPNTGRKKHNNKNKIGVFEDSNSKISLGYLENAKPISLNQMIFSNLTENSDNRKIKIKVILSPNHEMAYEEQANQFWDKVSLYDGNPYCIKDNKIPKHTYILGVQENRWFLGMSNEENPDVIKPMITRVIKKIGSNNFNQVRNSDKEFKFSSSQVTAHYSHCFNINNNCRIYAKIAFNCLAFLKGRDYVMSPTFDKIRNVILTGENASDYVSIIQSNSPLIPTIDKFLDKVPIGKLYHSIAFMKKDNCLYGLVSFFASQNPFVVKLSESISEFDFDIFICDWQNKREYKLIDYVLEICAEDNKDFV